jgi:hypothetical protein
MTASRLFNPTLDADMIGVNLSGLIFPYDTDILPALRDIMRMIVTPCTNIVFLCYGFGNGQDIDVCVDLRHNLLLFLGKRMGH